MKNKHKLLLFVFSVMCLLMTTSYYIKVKASENLDISSIITDAFSCSDWVRAKNSDWRLESNRLVTDYDCYNEENSQSIEFKLSEKSLISINYGCYCPMDDDGDIDAYFMRITDANGYTVDDSYTIITNKSGIFSIELEPGIYCLKVEMSIFDDGSLGSDAQINSIVFKHVVDDITIDYNPRYEGHDYNTILDIGKYSKKQYANKLLKSDDADFTLTTKYADGTECTNPSLYQIELVPELWGNYNKISLYGSWRNSDHVVTNSSTEYSVNEIYTITVPENDRHTAFKITINMTMRLGTISITYHGPNTLPLDMTYSLADDKDFGGKGWRFASCGSNKKGYEFIGWSTKSPNAYTRYTKGDRTSNDEYIITESDLQLATKHWYNDSHIDLYPIYRASTISYSIPTDMTLSNNGGEYEIGIDGDINDSTVTFYVDEISLTDEVGDDWDYSSIGLSFAETGTNSITLNKEQSNATISIDTTKLPYGQYKGSFDLIIQRNY